ncbi:MAG: nucleoside deaminase [Muribaculaceae bacterium]|nr:nucleoside deaminase [Muribaculaceae bacterium]MBR3831331.1 nucleoside deaminase [Muribaculaceae bacterium]
MTITNDDIRFLEMAAELAEKNIDNGGGPFGAVIVRNGEVVATGVNRVTADNDPTAHAEVNAIRQACQRESTFNLKGCVIYSSCEPCPMCLSALYWAGVSRIYYGCTQEDAEAVNFSDRFIYRELEKPKCDRMIPCIKMDSTRTIKVFEKWADKADKIEY